uniref:Putative structural protein n=1 Tax=viral metagenome TaxID=1070528 RepID=A0A6M3IZJ9_9ZZZZ
MNKTLTKSTEKISPYFRPKHYAGGRWIIEPWTFIMLNNIPFAEGNIIKYVMRWKDKNGIEDLHKAKRIIDMLIELNTNEKSYIPEKTCL